MHRHLYPIAIADTVYEHWVQVMLQAVNRHVASGYCPPKGDIHQQLKLFDITATMPLSTTTQWTLLSADVNAYHEA